MPIQHAVLSLLSDGPSHGYELKAAFEQAVGPQWGPLNIGHLYQVLDRLAREGMVTSTRVAQHARPDRVVYAITDAGTAELTGWMAEPSPRASGFRDDFFLKLVAAARTRDDRVIAQVVARQRVFLLAELRNLGELRREPGTDRTVRLLLTAAARHVEADLAFLNDALEALLADAGEASSGVASASPAASTVDEAVPPEPMTARLLRPA
jgi:DNA-binding PadR family transcriptional regulator